jgi:hypothetical protein
MADRITDGARAWKAAWRGAGRTTRRRVKRAINRGLALESVEDAALAVGYVRAWRARLHEKQARNPLFAQFGGAGIEAHQMKNAEENNLAVLERAGKGA